MRVVVYVLKELEQLQRTLLMLPVEGEKEENLELTDERKKGMADKEESPSQV